MGEASGGKGRFEEISRRFNSLNLGGEREKSLGRFLGLSGWQSLSSSL